MNQPKILCIYHNRDLDGLACAALFKWWFQESCELLGWDYSYNPDELVDKIKAGNYDQVYMADVSLPMTHMAQIAEYTEHFLWVDHHKSAIDDFLTDSRIIHALNGIEVVFPKPPAVLAACEVLSHMLTGDDTRPGPLVIQLLGRYDTWRQDGEDFTSWENCLAFQVALKSRWTEAIDLICQMIADSALARQITNEGRAILRFERAEMEQNAKTARALGWAYKSGALYNFDADKAIKTVTLNTSFNPGRMADVIWPLYPDARLLVCYSRAADGKWNYSLRSPKDGTDCSEIAKRFGGGGHFHAAGFQSKELFF